MPLPNTALEKLAGYVTLAHVTPPSVVRFPDEIELSVTHTPPPRLANPLFAFVLESVLIIFDAVHVVPFVEREPPPVVALPHTITTSALEARTLVVPTVALVIAEPVRAVHALPTPAAVALEVKNTTPELPAETKMRQFLSVQILAMAQRF